MAGRDIIVVGASAGGVEALHSLVRGLPADFPGTLFVALHISPQSISSLPKILSRAGPLPALHPDGAEPLRLGSIYVAPPDHHLLVRRGVAYVARGPREHRVRPAVDPLFRSAAGAHGRRVVGVVLSRNLNDGTAGLLAIKRHGGTAVVQDPEEAVYPGMPSSAVRSVDVDAILPIAEIPALLVRRLATLSRERGRLRSAAQYEDKAREAEHSADVIRQVVERGEVVTPDANVSRGEDATE